VGLALWSYGYFVGGHSALIDWHQHVPFWIADYLPNIEAELGMAILCIGTALAYWPRLGRT
jgi:hypothetical protein